jgi:hypothetical protein
LTVSVPHSNSYTAVTVGKADAIDCKCAPLTTTLVSSALAATDLSCELMRWYT